MKILYGVCAEGMGHATRSDVVARHLAARGHQVQFAVGGGRPAEYLRARWGAARVVEVPGFRLVVEGNRVMMTPTLLRNAATHLLAGPASHLWSAMVVDRPDVVIDDFCAWTARYARYMRLPLIAIDNIHFITRCHHPQEWIREHQDDAAAAMLVTESTVPAASLYFVLSFTRSAPPRQPLTALHLPIVRKSVADKTPTEGSHVVAYFNSQADWRAIVAALQGKEEIRAYGCPVSERQTSGNVTLNPFSEDGLATDLASARAAVSGAGFSFLSEALAMKKPLLAVPYEGSFEQLLNARYLEREGFGSWAPKVTGEHVSKFLAGLSPMKDKLATFPNDKNEGLFRSLDGLLQRVGR